MRSNFGVPGSFAADSMRLLYGMFFVIQHIFIESESNQHAPNTL